MPSVEWNDALRLIQIHDKELASALGSVLKEQPCDGEELPFLASYHSGDKILDNGSPIWPTDGTVAPSKFLMGQLQREAALGIIVENGCEVFARPRRSNRHHHDLPESAEALLRPGEFLGLFEYLDFALDAPSFSIPDWTIRAGATTIQACVNVETQKIRKHFEKLCPGQSFGEASCLFDYIRPLARTGRDGFGSAWNCKVLFLPRSFGANLAERSHQRSTRAADARLLMLLLEKAWRNQTRARRDIANETYHLGMMRTRNAHTGGKKTSAAKKDRLVRLDAAAELVEQIIRGFHGAFPIYAATESNDEFGPFAEISKILADCGTPGFVLRASYLAPGQTGFIRLPDVHHHFKPEAGGSTQARVEEVCHIINDLMFFAPGSGDNPVASNRRALEAAVFRVPPRGSKPRKTGRAVKKGEGQNANLEAVVFQVNWASGDEGGTAKQVAPEAFFGEFIADLAEDGESPGERAEFFRHAISVHRPA